MWTETTRKQYREDLRYASDMTDAEWALIATYTPAAKDFETTPVSSEAWIYLASVQPLARRLARTATIGR